MYFHFYYKYYKCICQELCKGSKISLYLQADSLTWHSFIEAWKNTWASGVIDKDLHYLWLSKKHKLQVLNLMWAMPWWALVDAVHTSEMVTVWAKNPVQFVCGWRDYTAWTTKWTLYTLVNTIFQGYLLHNWSWKEHLRKTVTKDIELFYYTLWNHFTIMVQWNRCNTIKQSQWNLKTIMLV